MAEIGLLKQYYENGAFHFFVKIISYNNNNKKQGIQFWQTDFNLISRRFRYSLFADIRQADLSCLPGRSERVSSLQSLVRWYQEHSRSCMHEPQLRALEPQPDFSTAAVWQCDSNHSFVQYLFSPPRQPSDSENEAEMKKEGDGGNATKIYIPVIRSVASRKKSNKTQQFRGVEG